MSSIFGTSLPIYVTTNTAQEIKGEKTFTALVTCEDGLKTNSILFNDGSEQVTAFTLTYVVPTGTISMFGGAVAPTGYLLCNGAGYNSLSGTYAALYAVIGMAYTTVADPRGATYFRVPDFRGVYPGMPGTNTQAAGQGSAFTTATFIGPSTVGNYLIQSLPLIPHTHTADYPASTGVANYNLAGLERSYYRSGATQQNQTSEVNGYTLPNSYTTVGPNVRPITLGVQYIIKL